MTRNTIYVSKCLGVTKSCRLSKKETRQIQTKSGNPNHRVCRYHGGVITNCESVCIECGETFLIHLRRQGKETCTPCEIKQVEQEQLKLSLFQKRIDDFAEKILEGYKEKRILENKSSGKVTEMIEEKVEEKVFAAKVKAHSWRGEYCTSYDPCYRERVLKCSECESYTAIVKGVDPGRKVA